jgi:hypothetical protein
LQLLAVVAGVDIVAGVEEEVAEVAEVATSMDGGGGGGGEGDVRH